MIELDLEVSTHIAHHDEVRARLTLPGLALKSLVPVKQPGRLNAELHMVGAEDELVGFEHGKRYKLTLTELETPHG